MYGIVTDKDNFVADNMIDPSGEARKGILLFKKKTDAVNECETLNELRGKMKLSRCYSVIKFKDDMDVPYFGIILDGLWKQSL